jgi:V/A-type H+-transporting ATPase subunit E
MEELRSTEILDKEIQEDARKKAERTLVKANEECEAILSQVNSRVQAALKEKESAYQAKLDALKRDKDAALPLEKKRFLVSFEGAEVVKAVNAYLAALPASKRLSLIAELLESYKPAIGARRFKAFAFGVEPAEAENLLKSVFDSDSLVSCQKGARTQLGESAVEGIETREGIILETEDGAIRARATLDEIIAKLLDTARYELTAALFGGRLPE